MEQIYFDHAATTPTCPEAIAAMLPYLQEKWGNPSSLHATGIAAQEGIERAREHVACILGAETDEIIFTASGTEADNHALICSAFAQEGKRSHIITSTIEHHAISHTTAFLASRGIQVTYLPVDAHGLVDPDDLRKAITDKTFLVSVMHANNEVGTIEPIAELGAICRAHDVLFHTDAVQTFGHLPIDVQKMNIDMLSLSAHKLYGPKGVGALYLRKGITIPSFLHGGGQELGRRASTENVAGIVALGEVSRLAQAEMAQETAHTSALRDRVINGVLASVPDVILTGHPSQRLANNASFCVRGVEGEAVVLDLDQQGFAVSSGSACTSGSLNPSHVLLALGIAPEAASGSVRISLGRGNTLAEVERFLDIFPTVVNRLRSM